MKPEVSLELLLEFGEKWLESKIQRMRNLLKIAEPDEALYREIMLSLGYPKNKVQFLELALILPYQKIKELKDKHLIEKALLYRAGFINEAQGLPEDFDLSLQMDKSLWDFKRIRPANYPDKRIKNISGFLADTIEDGLVEFFHKRIKSQIGELKSGNQARKSVKRIMNFKDIGEERKLDMFFNIILPFFSVYLEGKNNLPYSDFLRKIFEIHPPLKENSAIKKFKRLVRHNYEKLNSNTKAYFGILYYVKNCSNLKQNNLKELYPEGE